MKEENKTPEKKDSFDSFSYEDTYEVNRKQVQIFNYYLLVLGRILAFKINLFSAKEQLDLLQLFSNITEKHHDMDVKIEFDYILKILLKSTVSEIDQKSKFYGIKPANLSHE